MGQYFFLLFFTHIYKSTEYFLDDIEAQAKFKQLILEQWEFCVLSFGMTVTQKDTLKALQKSTFTVGPLEEH